MFGKKKQLSPQNFGLIADALTEKFPVNKIHVRTNDQEIRIAFPNGAVAKLTVERV